MSTDDARADWIAQLEDAVLRLKQERDAAVEACRMAAHCEPGWLARVKEVAGVR